MNKKPFIIAFITAGDPDAASTAAYIAALEKGGASVMELAVPFSDPTAEGEEIQESFVRALKGGMSVEKTFEILEQVRKNSAVPVILRSYLNPVLRYGYQKFFRRCAQLGVCALDVPDLPFEEREEVQPYARENGVRYVFYGHTHMQADDTIGGVRLINPGTFRRGNYCFATASGGKLLVRQMTRFV